MSDKNKLQLDLRDTILNLSKYYNGLPNYVRWFQLTYIELNFSSVQ